MPAGLSAYLDLIRSGAALVVLLSHAWAAFVPAHPLPWPAHEAVIVFFVLSGYVVAYVTATKERIFSAYALSRTARILSATLPALAIAAAVAGLEGQAGRDIARDVALNFFFVAQSWSFKNLLLGDPPYWSLCYEVWYYAIFAAAVFPSTRRARLIWTVLLGLAAGPRILVLMPCWLAGVALYHGAGRVRLGPAAAAWLFAASVAAFALFYWFDLSLDLRAYMFVHHGALMEGLQGSNQFPGDYILALIVSANFLGAYHLAGAATRWLVRHKRAIGMAASNTLSLYLYHYPAMLLVQHLGIAGWLGIPLTIGACLALAPFTEHRKTALRNALRAALARTRALAFS